MILPTKHLREDRALIAIGAELLRLLDEPKTVSRLWDELKRTRGDGPTTGVRRLASTTADPRVAQGRKSSNIPFDWFILGLDLLYALGAIELQRGRIQRVAP